MSIFAERPLLSHARPITIRLQRRCATRIGSGSLLCGGVARPMRRSEPIRADAWRTQGLRYRVDDATRKVIDAVLKEVEPTKENV